jgi:tetratricopeptide (TPR) repeat protein
LPLAVVVAAVLPFLGILPLFSPEAELPRGSSAGTSAFQPFSVEDYRALYPPDRSYRRVTHLSYDLELRVGNKAWVAHAAHLALNALVALLVYFMLQDLLRDGTLAALGAGLHGVLPIHVEAVATMAGRADLLGGMAIFLVWHLALKNSACRARGEEKLRWVLAASFLAFFGLFANEEVLAVVPLVLVAAWLLRRRVPWITFSSLVSAAAAYLITRQVVGASSASGPPLAQNPLAGASAGLRCLNAAGNLRYALARIVFPWNLSADYSYQQVPVLGLDDFQAWAWALGIGAVLVFALILCWRRAPLVSLSLFFFLVTILPGANFFFPASSIFSERTAYTASFGYALFLCALFRTRGLRRPGVAAGALGLLILVYGARSWERSREWAHPVLMAIQMSKDSPKSVWSHLKAAEAYLKLAGREAPRDRKQEYWRDAEGELQKALEIQPASGRAEELYARILVAEEKYAEAAERLTKAGKLLAQESPPEFEPGVYLSRGECFLHLGKAERAYEDFDLYIRLFRHLEGPPDALAYNRRGQARAEMGKLEEALGDFDTAITLRPDLPDLWNNRAFCRFSLKDARGAIEDYQKGLELCRKRGILYRPSEDSAWSFLLRIADVERSLGREAEARKLEAEAEKVKAGVR